MALTVENGTQVTGADSYISTVDAQTFLTSRGKTTVVTDALMYQAMDILNGLMYCGYRVAPTTQALAFPRSGVYLSDNRYLATNEIPQELKDAQSWLVFYIDANKNPSDATEYGVKKKKVDALEIEYFDTAGGRVSLSLSDLPLVESNLKYLLGGQTMSLLAN